MPTFSTEWTAEDRIKLALVLADLISTDVYAGRYSAPGRPNFTTLNHILLIPTASLESYRADIEGLLDQSAFTRDPDKRREFFETPLADYWSGKIPEGG